MSNPDILLMLEQRLPTLQQKRPKAMKCAEREKMMMMMMMMMMYTRTPLLQSVNFLSLLL
jgi:hypothetical protein